HIFLSVPQYNRIFVQIHKWFTFGIYEFASEKYMLSLVKVSSLYENYLLVKMIAYFQSRGYLLVEDKRCVYPVKSTWQYKNTDCKNTFVFKNETNCITLYYQPVIYDSNRSDINGIQLMRNNSLPFFSGNENMNQVGGHYYSPDYVIKVENNSASRYLILDAKFSDLQNVKRYYVKDLAFKYLFSISPIQQSNTVVGLCIIYGKCKSSERTQSAYDKQLPGQAISPIAELLPLVEGISNDAHFNRLDSLMKKIISF
ncbi:MAG: hypothetical protein LUC47_08585, partial [Clostridiales bacterium]|nr:hypothetical protein [Clostridiales bacterium]